MMSMPPRHLPRFLPTLTEVVQPPTSTRSPTPVMPDSEALSQLIMRRVEQVIEHRIQEEVDAMVQTLLTVQMQTLRSRLREELELVVRQAVSEGLASGLETDKLK